MKTPMSDKTPEMIAAIESIFPGTQAAIKMGNCPLCSNPITGFTEGLSAREFEISGMCQACQDDIFRE
jgi:hypothetical protein